MVEDYRAGLEELALAVRLDSKSILILRWRSDEATPGHRQVFRDAALTELDRTCPNPCSP
jgi:hypothetical protein